MANERIDMIMQTDYPTLRTDMPIRNAVALLIDTGWAAAPVVDDNGALIGILSQKDCFRAALNASYYQQWSGTVAERYSPNVKSLDAEVDFVSAAETFLREPYRAFPVTRNGELVGMINRVDLLTVFLRLG